MAISTMTNLLMGFTGVAYVILGLLIILVADDYSRGRISFWCGESLIAALCSIVFWPFVAPAAVLSFRLFGRAG